MGAATCKTCTGVIEPALNRRRNTETISNLFGEGSTIHADNTSTKSPLIEEEDGFDINSINSSFLQDLSFFIRTLPAKSKKHIWEHAVRKRGADGKRRILDSTSNQEQINKLLCDNVIVYVKVKPLYIHIPSIFHFII